VTQKEGKLSPSSSLADCLKLLRLEAQVITKTIFIIDTLDECDVTGGHRNEFLIGLRSLRSQVHILLTSRFDASIERGLEFDPGTEAQANNNDVKLYINHRLAREPQLASHIKKDTKLGTTISYVVTSTTSGMFLLVRLHLNALSMEDNRKSLRRAILRLPTHLDTMYDQTTQRIRTQIHQRSSRAEQVLSWLSCSIGPLTAVELQTALAVEEGDKDLDDEAIPEEDTPVSVCAGLVSVDSESNVIRLVHQSTREYLERRRISYLPSAQFDIAKTCVSYPCFDTFESGELPSLEEVKRRMRISPLFKCTALY
jgi:hypothetical protein